MTQHTPGPWTFGHWGGHFWVGTDGSGQGRKIAKVMWGLGEQIAEGRDNARLIAAAPDLLSAAKMFIAFQEASDEEDDVSAMLIYNEATEALRAAIAKAEGRK